MGKWGNYPVGIGVGEMKARNSRSDSLRLFYNVFLEPLLATACSGMAGKIGCKTRSKYIRFAVIRALLADGYPLQKGVRNLIRFVVKGWTYRCHHGSSWLKACLITERAKEN